MTRIGARNTSESFSPAPMIRPPTMAPGTEVKPPRISTGSAFSAISEIENCTPSLAPQISAGRERHQARHRPHDQPDGVERNADRLGRGMIVGDGAQRAADARLLEEDGEHDDQAGGDDGRHEVARIDQQAAREHALEQEDRILGQAEIDLVDVAAPQRLAEAVEEVGDAERRHEQNDAFLVHEMAQHQAFDGIGEQAHDGRRGRDREPDRPGALAVAIGRNAADQRADGRQHLHLAPLARPGAARDVLAPGVPADERDRDAQDRRGHDEVGEMDFLAVDLAAQPRDRERREQHHRALREVEDAGGLEDQHEAQRHQRIEHAGQQAADQGFEERAQHVHSAQWLTPR